MMKKIKILIIITLSLLLFSACGSPDGETRQNFFGFGGGGSSNAGSSSNSGVQISFREGNPPSEMFKGEPSTFGFIFTNHLQHRVEDLRIRTRGFDTGFVSGLEQTYSVPAIPSANPSSGPGVYSGFNIQNVRVDGFERTYPFNPVFDYCYTARTAFREQLCVPSSSNQCNLNINPSREQNGPLLVSLGRIQVVGDDILLPITITNRGNGEVVNECFNTDDFERDYTLVQARLGNQAGNCAPSSSEGYSLIQGSSTIYCRYSRTQDDAYASQISIDLEYSYQQTHRKQITVRDINI